MSSIRGSDLGAGKSERLGRVTTTALSKATIRTAQNPADGATIDTRSAIADATKTSTSSLDVGAAGRVRNVNGQSSSAAVGVNKSKLVFGLGSRTNKSKHDEYAEKRSSQQSQIETPASNRSTTVASTNKTVEATDKATRASGNGNSHEKKLQDLVTQSATSTMTATDKEPLKVKKSVTRSRSSERSPSRRKSLTDSTSSPPNGLRKPQDSVKADSEVQVKEEAPAVRKMQFNIPPPPQVNTSGKSSVVKYAKSRIYDKPVRHVLSNPAQSSLLDSGTIPKSIQSGFKPPKQINVSKAREKWEGGEPFSKCKSRQRLAAQAGKKLLHGTWSMTSVVATQQLQFQQALAQSNSTFKPNIIQKDSPVKILTRGSVLERVQQFEKAPGASGYGSCESSDGDTSSTTSSSSNNSNLEENALTDAQISSTRQQPSDEACITIDQSIAATEVRPSSPTSKQALYKNRLSSIQTSSAQQLDSLVALTSPRSPKSPQSLSGRRLSFRRRSSSTTNSSQQNIPKFYHPNGKPNTYEIELQKKNIVACFDKLPDRSATLVVPAYKRHFQSIVIACGFPVYLKECLYLYVKHQMTRSNLLHSPGVASRKQSGIGFSMSNGNTSTSQSTGPTKQLSKAASIDNSTVDKLQNQDYITCEQFLVCWRHLIDSCFDLVSRFVHLLTFGQRNYLLADDFVPLIQSIIDDHPGLKFLRAAPDFHMRYIQTVIARIYFCINRSWTGKISLSELRRSNLLAVIQLLSQEDDINQITDYFSYEHFYVIYCKFWSLDQDHDLLISKDDLAKHNDAAISSRIIDRIFMGIVSKQIQKTGKMSYSDFVWFLIAEEDKKHPRSIEYWFRLMDIDGDGYISMYEMEFFYYEQAKRLELMNIEALPFTDSACQILDLVNPKEANKISLSDLKRTRMATIFFDTFINLEKYLEHESREFASTRDVVQDGVVISDWDRYASEEYESLVTEETSV